MSEIRILFLSHKAFMFLIGQIIEVLLVSGIYIVLKNIYLESEMYYFFSIQGLNLKRIY